MESFVRLLKALGVVVFIVLTAAACDLFNSEASSCNGNNNCNVGGLPTGPGSTSTTATKIDVSSPITEVVRRDCSSPVTAVITATITPSTAQQKTIWMQPTNLGSDGTFVSNDMSAVLTVRRDGSYVTWGTAADNPNVKDDFTLVVSGCGGTAPPPAGQEPSVDLKFNGQDGPFNSNSPLSGEITASLTHCPTGYWTDGPFKGQIFGNGSKWTVTVNASTRYEAECEHQGRKDSDELRFTIGSSPPPSPTPVYACSDGKDNDGDGLIDAADPGCHTNNDINQPYNPTDNDENNPPASNLSCAGMNASYSRTDGSGSYTVAVNQNINIRLDQQSGWLSHCEVFYGVDKPSVIKAVGVVPIEVCSGSSCNWYYGGKSGVVTGVWPGTAEVFSQVVIRENMGQSNERWVLATGSNMRFSRPWNVVASTLQALGMEMPEAQKWVPDSRVPGGKVCLTWECR